MDAEVELRSVAAGMHLTRIRGDTRLWSGHSISYGLTITTAGAFDFWYRGRAWTQTRAEVKLKEPGEVHRDLRVHAPVSAQSLSIAPELIQQSALALGLASPPHLAQVLLERSPRSEPIWALHQALARPFAPGLELDELLSGALGVLLSACERTRDGRRPPRLPRQIARARDYLRQSLAENVRLDALAEAVELNKFTLLRAFRAELGLTPYAYLTHLRVARARELLAGGAAATQVALEVGYCDQSQLNRHFARIVGLSPGRFAAAVAGRRGALPALTGSGRRSSRSSSASRRRRASDRPPW